MKKNKEIVCCPHCGEEIEKNARVCVHCGSDENTGWSERTYLDGIDLPDDDEYDDLVGKEFGNEKPPFKWSWKIVAGILLVLFIIGVVIQLSAR